MVLDMQQLHSVDIAIVAVLVYFTQSSSERGSLELKFANVCWNPVGVSYFNGDNRQSWSDTSMNLNKGGDLDKYVLAGVCKRMQIDFGHRWELNGEAGNSR